MAPQYWVVVVKIKQQNIVKSYTDDPSILYRNSKYNGEIP